MASTELERVELLLRIFRDTATRPEPLQGVELGIGDDAAALAPGDGALIASVDAVVEHVHFERAWLSFGDLGYKATMAALSDLAAMGAAARGVLASLVLPDDVDDAALEAIARGQREACDEVGAAMLGGNLSRGAELSIATTVLGNAARPLRRSGARPGDGLYLAGAVGLAARGLAALRAGRAEPAPAIAAWRRPRAQIEAGLAAAPVASAAIDISDGLARDASHLAAASGVALVLDAGFTDGLDDGFDDGGLEPALHGGEDYALLVTSAASIAGFRRIGCCEPGAGVWLERADGTREAVARGGWDHFGARV